MTGVEIARPFKNVIRLKTVCNVCTSDLCCSNKRLFGMCKVKRNVLLNKHKCHLFGMCKVKRNVLLNKHKCHLFVTILVYVWRLISSCIHRKSSHSKSYSPHLKLAARVQFCPHLQQEVWVLCLAFVLHSHSQYGVASNARKRIRGFVFL